jgi:Cdc6-like AAA superfamily ATPase
VSHAIAGDNALKRSKPFGGLFGKKARAQKDSKTPVSVALEDLFPQERERQQRRSRIGLPRFQLTAADQLTHRGSDALSLLRANLRNAFTPSQPVMNPAMFAGRLGILAGIISSLEDQRLHLVIYGDRGIGKTSLLHMLSDAAKDARYIVIYTSGGAASNFDDTFRAAAVDIPLLYHSGYAPTATASESGATLADILPAGELTPRQFGEVCARITGTRVLIILDEFDRCESAKFRRDLAELIKILSDRSLRVQLVIAGVAADLADLVEHIPSIRRNILAIKVPLMTREEVEQLIANGERISGLKFDDEARELLHAVAHGSPYISSLVCHHAGLAALEAKRTTVRLDNVSAAIGMAEDELLGRLAGTVQAQITRALELATDALTTLAEASLRAGGAFGHPQIDAVAGSTERATLAKRIAAKLVEMKTLLTVEPDQNGPRYSFLDDGVASYLWFRATRQAFADRADEHRKRAREA